MVLMLNNKQYDVCIKILEQPVDSMRFRYESEKKSISKIFGINSTLKQKTFPSILIEGYKGCAIVVVSCVTKDPLPKPHPHGLVGTKCEKGICKVEIPVCDAIEIMRFSNLGIRRVKKDDIEEALNERQELGIDPFKTGFELDPNIDLNAVRLCFQVYLEGSSGECNVLLPPLTSNIIYEEKSKPSLVLHELCPSSAGVAGGQKVILLCDKVDKKDIKVRFFEVNENGQEVWQGFGQFQETDVHKQTAIKFATPKYRSQAVGSYLLNVELLRPSDKAKSNSLQFWMVQMSDNREQSFNSAEDGPCSCSASARSSLPFAKSLHTSQKIRSQEIDNVRIMPENQAMIKSTDNIDSDLAQFFNAELGPSTSADTGAANSLQPLRFSHENLQTIESQAFSQQMQSNNEILLMQKQQYQANTALMMSSVPANTQYRNEQLESNLLYGISMSEINSMSENQPETDIGKCFLQFTSADTSAANSLQPPRSSHGNLQTIKAFPKRQTMEWDNISTCQRKWFSSTDSQIIPNAGIIGVGQNCASGISTSTNMQLGSDQPNNLPMNPCMDHQKTDLFNRMTPENQKENMQTETRDDILKRLVEIADHLQNECHQFGKSARRPFELAREQSGSVELLDRTEKKEEEKEEKKNDRKSFFSSFFSSTKQNFATIISLPLNFSGLSISDSSKDGHPSKY